ncbi:24542_t:CDS:2 [Cetraspora pellucida]|uniref:24542_t:CDS:1 n=1 Tax=Cetraspora pellucida TaxID=1433469 RepID=A0A9N9EZG5_9GLOM|nr:24542_t:CDS:2 [Cetraspora pellucida]
MPRHYSNHRLTRGQVNGSSDPLYEALLNVQDENRRHVRRIRQLENRVRDLERELESMREDRDSWMERVTSNVADNYFNESRYDRIRRERDSLRARLQNLKQTSFIKEIQAEQGSYCVLLHNFKKDNELPYLMPSILKKKTFTKLTIISKTITMTIT